MTNKNMLPSVKIEEKKKAEAEKKALAEADEKALRAAIANTPVHMLQWLKNQCMFGQSKVAINPINGELDPTKTLYQSMREVLYLQIRGRMSLKQLKEVEYE